MARETYVIEFTTPTGSKSKTSVMANSAAEAKANFLRGANKGSKVVSVYKK